MTTSLHDKSGIPVPDDDGTFVFKLCTPSGSSHHFQSRHDNVESVRKDVAAKLAADLTVFTHFKSASAGVPIPDHIVFALSYTDEDGDIVDITSDRDVTDAVKMARSTGADCVVLFVQGGEGWENESGKSEPKGAEVTAATQKEGEEVEKTGTAVTPAIGTPTSDLPATHVPPPVASIPHQHYHRARKSKHGEYVFGVPKDLLVPASFSVLAVVIIGVFTISRLSSTNS